MHAGVMQIYVTSHAVVALGLFGTRPGTFQLTDYRSEGIMRGP